MKHKEHYREKDGSIQAIVSYKYDDSLKWKTKSKQGFKKMSDAKRWASSTIAELAGSEGRQLMDENMTLGDAIEFFMSSKSHLEYSTQLTYRHAMNHLAPYNDLKLSKLNAIKTQEIAACIPPGHTIRIRMLFKYMKDMDLIHTNYLKLPIQSPKNKSRLISHADYQKILNGKISHEARVFCIVAYHTGMRSGEILGLTPECVKKDKIIVNKQWTKLAPETVGFKNLKNKEKGIREIPINNEVYKALQSLPFNFAEGRYFTFNRSSQLDHPLKSLGIDHTPHDFRHTRASEMVHAGFNLKYIAYILGDKIETVISNYVGINEEMISEENKKFLAHL